MTSISQASFGHGVSKASRFQGDLTAQPSVPGTPQAMPAQDLVSPSAQNVRANFAGKLGATAPVRFGGVFMPGDDKVYNVDLSESFPLTPHLASNVRQALQLRGLLKRQAGDGSSNKLFLNLLGSAVYPEQDRAALADAMTLIPEKTDVVVKTHTTVDGLLAMQSATGKRFMYPGASMTLGPLDSYLGIGKDHVLRIKQELLQEYVFDLQTKLVERAGIDSREEAYKMLGSAKEFNSLEALHAGSKGLIDGILLPGQRVVTREDLDTFLARKGWDEKQVADFLGNGANISKVPSRPLADFSPESVPKLDEKAAKAFPKAYTSLKERVEASKKDQKQQMQEMQELDQAAEEGEEQAVPVLSLRIGPLAIQVPVADQVDREELKEALAEAAKRNQLPLSEKDLAELVENVYETAVKAREEFLKEQARRAEEKEQIKFYALGPTGELGISKELPLSHTPLPITLPGQMYIDVPGKLRQSVLDDDLIQFNDGFDSTTDNQIEKSLVELAGKKRQQDNPSNIKIVINSPGGSVFSAKKLRDTIKLIEDGDGKAKVDVIVQGMAASAGSWLLSSATGNRMGTPNARIMIHQAAGGIFAEGPSNGVERSKSMRRATKEYAGVVAEATGRSPEAVEKDFEKDVWVNTVEALFYGPKGLLDGILVGPDKVITRDDVYNYLVENADSLDLGGEGVKGWDKRTPEQKVDYFLKDRLRSYREGRDPETFSANNPFDNVLKTISEVAQRSARDMWKDAQFQRSMPNPASNSMDIATVSPIDPRLLMLGNVGQAATQTRVETFNGDTTVEALLRNAHSSQL